MVAGGGFSVPVNSPRNGFNMVWLQGNREFLIENGCPSKSLLVVAVSVLSPHSNRP